MDAPTVEGSDLPMGMPIHKYNDPDGTSQPLSQWLSKGNLSLLQQYTFPLVHAGRDLVLVGAEPNERIAALVNPLIFQLASAGSSKSLSGAAGLCEPRAVIIVPTRTVATSVAAEAHKLAGNTGILCVRADGTTSIEDLLTELVPATDLLVATPTRLLDLIERGALSMGGVRHLVFADADALLDLGFEAQLKRLVEDATPLAAERQSCLSCKSTSVVLSRLLPSLLRTSRVTVTASQQWRATCQQPSITQLVVYAHELGQQQELLSLTERVEGLCMIFVTQRRQCDMLSFMLRKEGLKVGAVHDRMKVKEREVAIANFSSGRSPILVCTDGALRSVELPHVHQIVSYEAAPSADVYADRLSFTSCSGRMGHAVTMVTDSTARSALLTLVAFMQESCSEVPRWLEGMLTRVGA